MTTGTVYRLCEGGVEIAVRLTPKSARDAVDGVDTGSDGRSYLKARVRAVPEKGKANDALVRLLAGVLGRPSSTVTIRSGGTSRLKTVFAAGDAGEIVQRLDALAQ
ncbi:DUF167 family protein [Mesorhizobium sp. CAU 1732]|uniref:DUF167 family protein n=1 Tax=Mesorhizobium sp. CAU 1732 TaxID=3140358 RepID=UPI003260635A